MSRLHLKLLISRYGDCAQSLFDRLGKERQGPTAVFDSAELLAAAKACAESPKPAVKTGVAKIMHGAKGLVKAAMKIDRASDETIAARRAACESCPELTKLTVAGVATPVRGCGKCGCVYEAKIRNAGESCPLKEPKWLAVKPAVTGDSV